MTQAIEDATAARLRRLRWTAFGLVAAAFVLSFFHRVAPAAIAGELQAAFQASGAALGALAGTYFYVYTVMQLPTGVLVDTLGPRRIVALGSVVAGAGSVAFGLAESMTVAAAGRTLVGLGVSVAFISVLKINAAWFPERQFATLSGLTVFMGNIGAVLSATPLAWLVSVVSWRDVFVVTGVLSMGLAFAAWFLVFDRPGDAGLPSMRELEGKDDHAPREGHWLEGLAAVVRNGATWPGFFVSIGLAGSFLAFVGLWAVPYFTQAHGMTRTEATYHTSLMLAMFAVGSLSVGALSDRLRRRKLPLLGLCFAYSACWIPWVLAVRMPMAASLAMGALMGFCVAGFTLTWAVAKEVNPPALSGMATSLVNTGGFLGVAVLQPLVGWVLDRGWQGTLQGGVKVYGVAEFRTGMAVLAAFAAAGLVAGLFLKETHCHNLTLEEHQR